MYPLTEKIHLSGRSVNSVARELKLNNVHVFNFIAKRRYKVGRATRKRIREFFISKGWLPKPKPRKPPTCKNCGIEYPTRKLF